MNQAVLVNIRLSLGLLKIIVKIKAGKNKLHASETGLQSLQSLQSL